MILQPTPSGFLRDGKPHLIVSGALHYGRVHPDLWRDRLTRIAAMGCNTVETYVPWNFHAPTPDSFDFTGWRDLDRLFETAADLGLDFIVRTGPYICGEWEAGGFPGWLLADPTMKLRCSDPRYLAQVDRWYDELIPRVAKHQTTRGGNIIMLQVENEYGSFGDDRAYLAHLRDGLRARGIDELLFTSDGPAPDWLTGGTIDGALATLNFGSRAAEVLDMARVELPNQPQMCMEYWNGWFDHWGEEHHTRDAASAAAELETMLSQGMSVNFYMAHGGTNFGLWNGSNHSDPFSDVGIQPTVTSYDYDSPIGEDGRLAEKFTLFRDVIAKYLPIREIELPPIRIAQARPIPMRWTSAVDSELWGGEFTEHPHPPTFEEIGLERGMMHLRRTVRIPDLSKELRLLDLHDRKGILRGVWLGFRFLNGWQVTTWPLEEYGDRIAQWATDGAELTSASPAGAQLGVGSFTLDEVTDAHLDVSSLGHAVVWVNGFCLGRANAEGPQRTLYIPSPVLVTGENMVSVLDLAPQGTGALALADEPQL